MFGLNSIVFRPHNAYGENQNIGDRYRNVIGTFINQTMRGKPLTDFSDGQQQRAFSYIGDVAPHIARSVNVPAADNQTFNIGADTPYTVHELVQVLGYAVHVRPEVRQLPPRREVLDAYATHDAAQRVLEVRATAPPAEGIDRTAWRARQVGLRRGQDFADIEVRQGPPSAWASAA